MTWLLLHDILQAQKSVFPNSNVRPFADDIRAAKTWPKIERMFKKAEAASRRRIQKAVQEFVDHKTWPSNLSPKERMWIRWRIDLAAKLAIRLSVGLGRENKTLPFPRNQTDTMIWLLESQWDCFGMSEFLGEMKFLFRQAQQAGTSSDPPWWN